MFDAVNHPVLQLKRIAIGDLTVGGLEEGQWRYLSKDEVEALKGGLDSDGSEK